MDTATIGKESIDGACQGWEECEPGILNAFGAAIENAMNASFKRNQKWGLVGADFDVLMARSRGRCELTGLRFSFANPTGARRRPFLPSIDRIQHDQPYTLANCRLVCCCVNIALNDWGDDVFWAIVESAWQKRHGAQRATGADVA